MIISWRVIIIGLIRPDEGKPMIDKRFHSLYETVFCRWRWEILRYIEMSFRQIFFPSSLQAGQKKTPFFCRNYIIFSLHSFMIRFPESAILVYRSLFSF